MENLLEKEISKFSWIFSKEKINLEKKGIKKGLDLLFYLPRKYEDRSSITKIETALEQSEKEETFIATIICECESVEKFYFKNRNVRKYFFSDGIDIFSISAFNPAQRFTIKKQYILCGRLKKKFGEIQMLLHEWEEFDEEVLKGLHIGRVVPIYPMTENLSQKRVRTIIKVFFEKMDKKYFVYNIPKNMVKQKKMEEKKTNLWRMHFPANIEQLEKAREELAYEEFFTMQITMAWERKKDSIGKSENRYNSLKKVKDTVEKWPLTLTKEQKKSIEEIFSDMFSSFVMNRLLQGEVGSGKTLVALCAMMLATSNGYQAAFMAPTDILAKQHYQSFCTFAKPYGFNIYLLVAQQTQKEKNASLHALATEKSLIVVGTHALIQESVSFCNLSLAVIDEQHRFGVEQRKQLKKKGEKVDFLSLSATPIPRSLTLTIFGDQERSELHKRPAARTAVKSKVIFEEERPHAYRFMLKRLIEGEQGYVVFPVIDENEKLKSLIKEYDKLKEQVFKSFPTAFIHGRMKVEEKDSLMDQFRKKLIKVLFCTTVLEVGIDHPNATIMIIESAHQFGISQLHQLRGRVGRHEKLGFCYLTTKHSINTESIERLKSFCKITDGFKIAELDLQIRGPGELAGNRQSGFLEFHFANLKKDMEILLEARKDAYGEVFAKKI